jgi:hypothetical protein
MTPVAVFSVSPVGSVPVSTDQLYGVVPPVAASVWRYALPTTPAGRLGDVTVNVPSALIVSAIVPLSEWLALSVTCTVKTDVPADEGVPLMTPVVASDSPPGSVPLVRDQV